MADMYKTRYFEHLADYVAICFSKDPQDLDQWRTYGDNGRGYALEFDGPALEKHFLDPQTFDEPGSTFHVRYKAEEISKTIQYLIDLTDQVLSRNEHPVEAVVSALVNNIVLISLMFKHAAYEREGEIRFMQIENRRFSRLKFKQRLRPHKLINYLDFGWEKVSSSVITKIIVGPAAPNEAMKFAEDCRRIYLGPYHPCRIERMDLPYRT